MEIANTADTTENSRALYVNVKKAKTTHFPQSIEEVVKSLWRKTDGIFIDNPRHAPKSQRLHSHRTHKSPQRGEDESRQRKHRCSGNQAVFEGGED